MIKEAIDRILQLGAPNIEEINDRCYTDKPLQRIDDELTATPFVVHTLTGLVDYIKTMPDMNTGVKYMIRVSDPTHVELISELNGDRKREQLVNVVMEPPLFPFGKFINSEEFIINVQSKFVDDADRALVLKFAGNVKCGTVSEYGDDGVGQKATIKRGVASLQQVEVPNPCTLRPYRTFTEVKQPASSFIFRVKDYDDSVAFGLFEADGGAWKNAAMDNIAAYLAAELEGIKNVCVIC